MLFGPANCISCSWLCFYFKGGVVGEGGKARGEGRTVERRRGRGDRGKRGGRIFKTIFKIQEIRSQL